MDLRTGGFVREGSVKFFVLCCRRGNKLPKQSCLKVINHVLEPDVNEVTFSEGELIYRYVVTNSGETARQNDTDYVSGSGKDPDSTAC